MNTDHITEPTNVPVPVGATADGWHSVDHGGVLVRSLEWSRHDAGKVSVGVDGFQRATGEHTCGISFYGAAEGESIDPAQARDFAAALLEAADELERLDGAHAVDSATRRCCGGIGKHAPGCGETNENTIVICDQPDERNEIVCTPFEPHDRDYAGERFLAINYNGAEESFVVLTAAQATRLAELLTGQQGVTR